MRRVRVQSSIARVTSLVPGVLVLFALVALAHIDPRTAEAAAGDGPCSVMPSPVSNLEPTLVTLRSVADDATDPIAAHVILGTALTVRDPEGNDTAKAHQRTISAVDQTVLGQNIGFVLPPANMAGEFEVLTPASAATSDCTSGVSGSYDGLAIGQAQVLTIAADATQPLTIRIRGAVKGAPLRETTMVTLSSTKGEFTSVNGTAVTPSKVVQLTLTSATYEGAAVGLVEWRPAANERAASAVLTATATQDGSALFKSVTATITPPPLAPSAGFIGTLPLAGQTALLVATRDFEPAELALALDGAGCLAQSIATLSGGAWSIYVPGAPAAVNERFADRVLAETPFVVRCLPG